MRRGSCIVLFDILHDGRKLFCDTSTGISYFCVIAIVLKQIHEKDASLLTSTNLSVSSIAEYLGYQDTTNLIRSFKKYYGSTPAQYRKALH